MYVYHAGIPLIPIPQHWRLHELKSPAVEGIEISLLHSQVLGCGFLLYAVYMYLLHTAGGIDAVPTKTEGRGRGRGRRRGRPRVVAGSAGGLGRGERKQREDTFTVEPQQGAPGGRSLEDQGTCTVYFC